MGTTTYTTDRPAGRILSDEFAPYKVRMFTSDHEAAAVAVVVPITDDNRADILRDYDLPANAKTCVMAAIVKHEGTLNRPGARLLSIKVMSEDMGPYYTGGANRQFMNVLTPLKPSATYAAEWRARAWGTAA